MLCSSCSAPVKPVVAIDIDGTLANYHRHFSEFSRQFLGVDNNLPDYTGDCAYKTWWCEVFKPADLTTFRQVKLAYRQGGMKRTQPKYAYARALVQKLRDQGAEVWLTTTRPHDRYDRVDPDTREWMRRNHIESDALLFSGRKMDELAERVTPSRVVAVLDDQVDVLEDARSHGWTPILRRTKYNRDVDWNGMFILDLHDAYEEIKALLEAWRRHYG